MLLVSACIPDGEFDRLQVIPILHGLSMPAISIEALLNVFRKGEIGGSR